MPKIRVYTSTSMSKFQVEKQHTLQGHHDCVYTLSLASEAHYFYSAGGDGFVVRWNLLDPGQGKVVAKVPTSIYAIHHNHDRNVLTVGQNYEGIHRIDLNDGRILDSIKLGEAALFDIQQAGPHLIVATGEGDVVVLNYDTLAVTQKINPTRKRARAIALNNKAKELAVGFSDHTIRIYDTTSYQLKQTLEGHSNSVFTVKYTPDYHYLVTGGRDAHLKIWDVRKNYQLTESIAAHMYAINYLDFSSDSRYFATGSMDKSVKVWDAQQFRLLKVIDKARHAGHGTSVNRVLWLPSLTEGSRRTLVSASDDRTVSVWNLQENEQ